MTEQELILEYIREHGRITLMEAAPLMPEAIRATTHVVLAGMVKERQLEACAASQTWTLYSWVNPASPSKAANPEFDL